MPFLRLPWFWEKLRTLLEGTCLLPPLPPCLSLPAFKGEVAFVVEWKPPLEA